MFLCSGWWIKEFRWRLRTKRKRRRVTVPRRTDTATLLSFLSQKWSFLRCVHYLTCFRLVWQYKSVTFCYFSWFLARDSMLSALYAIARPSVCPSVCHTGGSVKTVKVRIMQFSPYSSPIPLVFGRPYGRLWYPMSSVVVVVCLSVTFCIVAKRHILAKNCLKEQIG